MGRKNVLEQNISEGIARTMFCEAEPPKGGEAVTVVRRREVYYNFPSFSCSKSTAILCISSIDFPFHKYFRHSV